MVTGRGAAMVFLLILATAVGMVPATVAVHKGYSFWRWWAFGAILFIPALAMALWLTPTATALRKRGLDATPTRAPPGKSTLRSSMAHRPHSQGKLAKAAINRPRIRVPRRGRPRGV